MKKIILIALVFTSVMSCKKKTESTPTPTPQPTPCATPTKLAVGKWKCTTCNQDTINVVFYSANCDNSKETYFCYHLNETVRPCVSSHTLPNGYVYGLVINEAATVKQGDIGGYTGSLVRLENDTTLHIVMTNEGEFYFNKVH